MKSTGESGPLHYEIPPPRQGATVVIRLLITAALVTLLVVFGCVVAGVLPMEKFFGPIDGPIR